MLFSSLSRLSVRESLPAIELLSAEVVDKAKDYFPFTTIDSLFDYFFPLPLFISTENNIFSSFEKGTSTRIVPKKPKQRLMKAIAT